MVPATRLMAIALTIYSLLYLAARTSGVAHAHMKMLMIVAVSLVGYWMLVDTSVLTEMRYPFRTAVMAMTPALGALAAAYALSEAATCACFRLRSSVFSICCAAPAIPIFWLAR